jgi:hypothetical protein
MCEGISCRVCPFSSLLVLLLYILQPLKNSSYDGLLLRGLLSLSTVKKGVAIGMQLRKRNEIHFLLRKEIYSFFFLHWMCVDFFRVEETYLATERNIY